ncbi:MAG: hypothetical protein SFU25_11200 [Candidatus Caenarcaniphilales bacterium]|nr:hypothetical protein [Candidatus Caenarcaniphilales bacterium]
MITATQVSVAPTTSSYFCFTATNSKRQPEIQKYCTFILPPDSPHKTLLQDCLYKRQQSFDENFPKPKFPNRIYIKGDGWHPITRRSNWINFVNQSQQTNTELSSGEINPSTNIWINQSSWTPCVRFDKRASAHHQKYQVTFVLPQSPENKIPSELRSKAQGLATQQWIQKAV